jgi:aspartate/methionine/tyrosine aminotransferase
MLPDYAAYEDILDRFAPRIRPVGVAATVTDGEPAALVDAVTAVGLRALLISNPRNPTGEVIAGGALAALVKGATATGCALLFDEFYSHYVYGDGTAPVSAAAHIDDVDDDPVLLFDGLTKNFRYPGWRLGWVVGPAETVSVIERVGQAMDGGPSQVVQRAAVAALEPGRADAETAAVRAHFAAKRDATVEGLRAAGIRVDPEPAGTFYVWGCLAGLPEPLRDAHAFFHAALDHRVITVPGPAFDLDPGHTRGDTGAFDSYVRFSYGPPMASVETGLQRLAALVDAYR